MSQPGIAATSGINVLKQIIHTYYMQEGGNSVKKNGEIFEKYPETTKKEARIEIQADDSKSNIH